jgi:ATP-dependent RNA helicase RhlE
MPQHSFNRRPRGSGRPHSARHSSFRGRASGRSQGAFRAPQRRGVPGQQYIDPNRFINKVTVTEEVVVYAPEHRFVDFPISDALKKNIVAKGYSMPTPIQDRAIPHVLRGEDVVGIANTGTGKTAAFLIPLIDATLRSHAVRTLIMVPTRELALQIEEEFRGFAKHLHIHAVTCVGGMSIHRQMDGLRRHPHIVIGTPGRLKDLIERKALQLSQFSKVVLDEADRMLDMGFIHMPTEKRHTLFFSATLSRDIENIIADFLKNPIRISVKTADTARTVEQDVVRVQGRDKLDVLHDLLRQPEFSRVIIFGRTKHGVEKLAKTLVQRGFKAESIHGNKTQNKRQRSLMLFKSGHVQVLVATDVAARGIDVADVSHVINYDIPTTYEDYVHRIGRTGRAGKRGKALTFID